MNEKDVQNIAENIFHEFMKDIEDTELYNKYVVEVKDGTSTTKQASDLLSRINNHLEDFHYEILFF